MALGFQNIGIENPYILLVIIPAVFLLYRYVREGGMNRRKRIFIASRTVILSLLLLAIASPYSLRNIKEFRDAASVIFLYDVSGSMSIYPGEIRSRVDELYRSVKGRVGNLTGYPDAVSIQYFSEGNRTEIGNVLYQNALKTDTKSNLLVLISDGNNNYGRDAEDVASVLSGMNTTISALIPNSAFRDIYLADIRGRKKVPAGTEYRIKVKVGKTGEGRADYQLNIYVDGKQVNSVNAFQDENMSSRDFVLSFTKRGPHKIVAEVVPKGEDYFPVNNIFLKAIDVVDKPHILVISDDSDSPLLRVLREGYEVTVTDSPVMDPEDYDAVFIDNKAIEELGSDFVSSINSYVVAGNGLVVVGGDKAYEKGGYYNSPLERILPVVSTEIPKERRKDIAVVFLIDRSGSSGAGVGQDIMLDVEKAIVINLIRQLKDEDKVGVIAFSATPYVLSDLKSLGNTRDYLEDKLPRLQTGQGTAIMSSLILAERYLEDITENKHLIILSDGFINENKDLILSQINAMAEKGIVVHTVFVKSGWGGDSGFMTQIAMKGRGAYFEAGEYDRLKLEFGRGEEDRTGKNHITIHNRYHFITQDIEDADVEGMSVNKYNGVTDKSIAQMLITTGSRKPLVTVWRFGLGRVVSISTDNGESWGPNLYRVANGQLINAITNWAIGDLEKGRGVVINSRDGSVGRESEISIDSTETPYLIAQHEGSSKGSRIGLKEIDRGRYTGTLYMGSEGFYFLRAGYGSVEDTDAVAVNYPTEYSRLGVNREKLSSVTRTTGGRVYNMSQLKELEQDAVRYAQEGSMKKTIRKNSLAPYIAILALLIFFIDVVVRRIHEIRKPSKG